ncbi:MAG: SDR family oxidoreductase [Rhodobacteraceae bacterium]|nr:SDR family oxidoreductase [Paracoccaceae bacterium]
MNILVTGAAGMLGARLSARLLGEGLGGRGARRVILADAVRPDVPGARADCRVGDISDPQFAAGLLADRPEVIFHLAAIVSGEAEQDYTRGYRVNLDGTRHLFDAVRAARYCPRVVFASSVAVFGGPFPQRIPDDFIAAPQTSYGTQKVMGELLLEDLTRRGHMDGVALRLPTICIRPGRPNKAASGFFSGILREPLAGQEAVLPVPDDIRHWFASPAAAVANLLHAGQVDLSPLGHRRALNLPGLSATVGDQIEALRQVAGADALRLIQRRPDATITRIISSWAQDFDPVRATAMGFSGDASFVDIIRQHLAETAG